MSTAGVGFTGPEEDEERWVREDFGFHQHDVFSAPSAALAYIEHLDGVPWHDALPPFWLHRCRAQTRGRGVRGELIERCACGAIRFEHLPGWGERNQRRRDTWRHEKWAGVLYLMFAAMVVTLVLILVRCTP